MNQELFLEYDEYLKYDQKRQAEIKKKIRQLAFLRLLAFLLVLFCLIYAQKEYPWIAYSVAFASTILFFYWIKLFLKREKEKTLFANLIEINKKEILALSEDYSQFENGQEFIDSHHHYTFDLDIFGEGSIFQFTNRTATQLGKKKLANYLAQPGNDISMLKKRQEALIELADYTRWRHLFSAKGQTKDEDDFELIKKITASTEIKKHKKLNYVVQILSVISIISFLLCQFTDVPWALFVGSISFNGLVLYLNRKTIKSFYNLFGSQNKLLSNYKELLVLIENKEFSTPLLQELQSQLLQNNHKASYILSQLQKAMAEFDYRQNILIAVVLNAVCLWDLRCSLKLHHWQTENKDAICQWFQVIAEFDALSSLANLNHNHPEWTLPKFEGDDFHVTANDLRHPLIKSAKCIGNDFQMKDTGQIAIITGANMAGKSTFLRAVGVNMILAMNGCRACASSLSLKPVQLFTNMRTTDNLQNDESYFFAELQRLKAILDEIKSGKEVFVIIDEMLKGTNSEDKLSGSIKLIEQLISLQAVGLVATHDLKLTSLAQKYPRNITNKCFEIQLNEDELLFDYKLTDGVTTTMNANFLMRKMGIIS